jgi:hypothetical protein
MTGSAAADLACALDAAQFMKSAGLDPDPWQADLLRSRWQRAQLLCTRQAGKSTVASVMAAHEAVYRPASLVLLLSPSMRQSGELFRKTLGVLRAAAPGLPIVNESALRVELANGSRILSLPGTEATVRGFSGVTFLAIDEAARVPDELYYAVRPMLAVSQGRLVALSTPFGKRGWFHQEWTDGAEWQRVRVSAQDCPRISEEFLAEERRSLGDWWFRQEYECLFVESDDSVFRYEDVMAAISSEVVPLFGGAK